MTPSTSFAANFSSELWMQGHQTKTNATKCPPEKTEEWVYTVLEVYILFISALGILLNVFVLVVFCFHKKRCTVAEIYLSNLTAADLVLVSFLPFWAVSAVKKFDWPFGQAMCRIVNLSIVMNVYCSVYFLCLVSLDRYLALVKPLSNENMRTPKFAKLGCLLVWGLGLLLSVPTIIYRDVKAHNNYTKYTCHLDYPGDKELMVCEGMVTIFSFIIPISFISFCTWKILQALNNRLTRASKTQQIEQRATTLILAVLLAFLICWVPFHLVRTVELLYRVGALTHCGLKAALGVCKQVFMYLAYFNSVLNPILYVIVGKNFRKKAKEIFKSSFRTTSTRTGNSGFNPKCRCLLKSVRF